MCHHHRGRYSGAYDAQQPFGYYNRRGCHGHRHGGPLSALVALAMPLLTQNSQQQQQQQRSVSRDFNDEKPQDAYYQSNSGANLAPQVSGRTATREVPIAAPAPRAPTTVGVTQDNSTPRDPPPAYEDSPSREVPKLEKSLESMTISSPPPPTGSIPRDLPSTSTSAPRAAPAPAPAYTPIGVSYAQQESQRQIPGGYQQSYTTQQQQQQQQIILNPNSRWAAKLQRKEEKVRAKMARKAEKYARKERRELERM